MSMYRDIVWGKSFGNLLIAHFNHVWVRCRLLLLHSHIPPFLCDGGAEFRRREGWCISGLLWKKSVRNVATGTYATAKLTFICATHLQPNEDIKAI